MVLAMSVFGIAALMLPGQHMHTRIQTIDMSKVICACGGGGDDDGHRIVVLADTLQAAFPFFSIKHHPHTGHMCIGQRTADDGERRLNIIMAIKWDNVSAAETHANAWNVVHHPYAEYHT